MPMYRKSAFPLCAFHGPVSDLLGLRLPLPLQSRPAQISGGPMESTQQLGVCFGDDFLSAY